MICFRRIAVFIIAALAAFTYWGCAKELSKEGGDPPPPSNNPGNGQVKSEWRFNQEANKFHGPVDTAFLTREGVESVLTLTGRSATDNRVLSMKIKTADPAFTKGKTYSTTGNALQFRYGISGDLMYRALPLGGGGDIYLTITDVGPDRIVATFKGLVIDKQEKSLFITDGHISSPLKKGPQSNNGYLMLWADEDCNGPVKVKVNGKDGVISKFNFAAPDCGEEGTATYNLPPGTYSWVAYCGKDSIFGNASVRSGSCTKLQVRFPFRPTPATNTQDQKTCRLSELAYTNDLMNDERIKANHIFADFDGTAVTRLRYWVAPSLVIVPHPVTYHGDTVFLNADNQYRQYFVRDGKGRVVTYQGIFNPTMFYPMQNTLVQYTYNNQDELVKRAVLEPRYRYVISETEYTWQGGNIVSKKVSYPLSGAPATQVDFEYYNKEVRSMPFIDFDAFEVVFYQPLVNFGKACKNILSKQVLHAIGDKIEFRYDSYLIDENNYVQSCRMTNDSKNTRFQFRYICF